MCPSVNADLWSLFWVALQGCEEVQVNWIPAHVDPDKVSSLAFGNWWADEAARGFLQKAFSRIGSFRKVYNSAKQMERGGSGFPLEGRKAGLANRSG